MALYCFWVSLSFSAFFFDVIVINHMLEQLEGVILMVNTRGIVEDTDIDVLHLIVTHKEENWSVDKLVRV